MKIYKSILPLAIAMVGLLGCSPNEQGKQQAQASEQGYKLLTLQTENRSVQTEYSASLLGQRVIKIFPQISGTLKEQRINEGESVRRGQVLFVIDQVPYQAALAQANANVQAAQAAVSTAKIAYEAKERLHKERIISDIELKTSHNNLQNAEAALAQAKAAALSARNNLSYTTITSPADGVAGILPYSIGALVGPNMAESLTVISENQEMDAYFSLDEAQLLGILRKYGSVEAAMKQMPDVELRLSDGSLYPHKGRIESISGVVEQSTGASQIRAHFPNPDRLLRSGSAVSVILPMSFEEVCVVPQSATVRLQDKILVYKEVDGKAVGQVIRVAPLNNGQEYIVVEGLKAGDVIVAEGAGLLREGMPLK